MISLSTGQTVPSTTSSFWVSCASLQQLFWLREEGGLINHDLSEQRADGSRIARFQKIISLKQNQILSSNFVNVF
jgi:hypothetical protein